MRGFVLKATCGARQIAGAALYAFTFGGVFAFPVVLVFRLPAEGREGGVFLGVPVGGVE